MRTQFIETEIRYKSKKQAPWSAIVAKCWDGFMAFESVDDYRTWKNQK